MNYNELNTLLDKLLKGDNSIVDSYIKEQIHNSYYEGEITSSEYRELSKKLSEVNVNMLTSFDNYNDGISDLLHYYHEDYNETNYEDYDLDMKIERDMLIDIIEKVDCNKSFSSKDVKTFVSFLEEIKKEHYDLNIQKSLNYMIDFIKSHEE